MRKRTRICYFFPGFYVIKYYNNISSLDYIIFSPLLWPLAEKNGVFFMNLPNPFSICFSLAPVPKNGTCVMSIRRCRIRFSMNVNDSNKSKFFRMEREHFPDVWTTLPDFRTTKECQDFINQAIHDPVFLRKYPHAADMSVHIRPGRRARRMNWWRSDNSIAVPRAFRRKHLLLHSAAHLVQPEGSLKHGWEFLKLYLALIHRELGKDASTALRAALKEHKISHRKPRGDSDSVEFKQMLRERMRKINEQRN